MTPSEQGIDSLIIYPNPFNPARDAVLNFGFTLRQKDCDVIGIKIYTAGFRKIRDEKFQGPDKDAAINSARISLQGYKIGNVADGAYYYYIYVEKQGVITRSKVDKLIILK
jgi:hypothetical protein